MEIADIGGATGVFSYWLSQKGHNAHLLDYMPSHIEKAKEKSNTLNITLKSYICGDARQVPYQDNQFDLVLEMGPLYHLQKRNDRIQCLTEAERILKNDGIVICEVISRYVNVFEGFQLNLIDDEQFLAILDENLSTGLHSPGDTSYFTNAYFHTHDEIRCEMEEAGFVDILVLPVEGIGSILNAKQYFENEQRARLLLKYIKETENIPELLGVSGHLMAIGKKCS
ncbi:MAG: class I SAM-dependent methyltransferase [Oscillospiraceae bacterium]|nr:class I SAM-dependent methyltransferase [Oscillospiraceae bacterium]